jgi:hypothetical protein
MRRLFAGAIMLLVGHSSPLAVAAELQIDEHTLCPAVLHAFDGKDSTTIHDFYQFLQNVFDELDAQYMNGGERAVSKSLT